MYIYIYYKRQENLLFIINLEKKIYISDKQNSCL